MQTPNLSFSASTRIDCPPGKLYAMVSDVTRMGEWSPVCKACWWDEGSGPEVGAWFTGRNEIPERTWETRSQVIVAEPGKEFAFMVGGNLVRWGYTLAPAGDGTEVTESRDMETTMHLEPRKSSWPSAPRMRARAFRDACRHQAGRRVGGLRLSGRAGIR